MEHSQLLALFSEITQAEVCIAAPSDMTATTLVYNLGEEHEMLYSVATGQAILMRGSEVLLRSDDERYDFQKETLSFFMPR